MAEQQNQIPIPDYFKSIALGLPGGGFRAAGYSLGILSFLFEVGLIDYVRAISSVSGGSITAAKFVDSLATKKSFPVFFLEMKEWLLENKLLENALRRFNDKNEDFGHKRRTLINAFALEYEEFITSDFNDLREGLKDSNFEDLIINATDFEHGHAFRFRLKKPPSKFGNYDYNFSKVSSGHVKLSDAVAASSCFPGGFEPIEFPDDFLIPEHIADDDKDNASIGLMDGGIIDNQGSSSYLTTDLNYDTYLIADASEEEIDGFDYSQKKWLNMLLSFITPPIISVIFFILTIALLSSFGLKWFSVISLVLTVILFIYQLILSLLMGRANNLVGKTLLTKLPRKNLGNFFLNRLNSLLVLNSAVFLKSSKSQRMTSIYQKAHYKVSTLSIYDLKVKEGKYKIDDFDYLSELGLTVSSELDCRSSLARKFDTTLWFDYDEQKKKEMLDSLILTGRAVCCQNLIVNMYKQTKYNRDLKVDELATYIKGLSKEELVEYINDIGSEKFKKELKNYKTSFRLGSLKNNRFMKELIRRWEKFDEELKNPNNYA